MPAYTIGSTAPRILYQTNPFLHLSSGLYDQLPTVNVVIAVPQQLVFIVVTCTLSSHSGGSGRHFGIVDKKGFNRPPVCGLPGLPFTP